MASGINSTFRQVGVAAGIAALGSIFQGRLSSALRPSLAGTPVAGHVSAVAHAVAGGAAANVIRAVPPGLRARATVAVHSAYAGSLDDILLVGALIAIVGAVLALVLVRGSDFATYGAPKPADAAATA
jgi:hypothetical protein